jgi:hypothetical protein
MSEIGASVLTKISNLRLEGLFDGDEVSTTLLAAVFAEALRMDETPRQVLDALWESLPPDDLWREIADRLADACDEAGGGGG